MLFKNVSNGVGQKEKRIRENPAVNQANQQLLDSARGGVNKFSWNSTVEDRSFGATLAGQLAIKNIELPNGIKIETLVSPVKDLVFVQWMV